MKFSTEVISIDQTAIRFSVYSRDAMEFSDDAMKVSLRVLIAISERTEPDAEDVKTLRAYAPLRSDAPLDELACDVIQQALRRRGDVMRTKDSKHNGAAHTG